MLSIPPIEPVPQDRSAPAVALADCNNFYTSCERVFQPRFEHRPVVVLSNNDGCVIARSNEAKVLGIEMGTPYFKLRELIRRAGVAVFSSNYELYGDMSQRVMSTLAQFSTDLEVYSIDEAFLNLTAIEKSLRRGGSGKTFEAYARRLRATVRHWTGIPVSIGIAETKTLAKIANRLAKKTPDMAGVMDLRLGPDRDAILERIPVGDVWGIGSRHAIKLERCGIRNARQLRDADDRWVQKELTIVGLRLVHELRGIPCLALELVPPAKKGITASRSFSRPVVLLEELQESVAEYVSRAAVKLRRQGSVAKLLTVFVMTNPFKKEPQYYNSKNVVFPVPTANTPELIHYARTAVKQLFRPGYRYKKTGVMLTGLIPNNAVQGSFFDIPHRDRDARLMTVLDRVNARMGQATLYYAAAGIEPTWRMRREHCSPQFTTDWKQLAVVSAGRSLATREIKQR
ncbi:MAG: Y-family DNA polymerase [bacterium]|jgi:DNA polymerase V|nr:Y-family DNA polymerase [bacterium]